MVDFFEEYKSKLNTYLKAKEFAGLNHDDTNKISRALIVFNSLNELKNIKIFGPLLKSSHPLFCQNLNVKYLNILQEKNNYVFDEIPLIKKEGESNVNDWIEKNSYFKYMIEKQVNELKLNEIDIVDFELRNVKSFDDFVNISNNLFLQNTHVFMIAHYLKNKKKDGLNVIPLNPKNYFISDYLSKRLETYLESKNIESYFPDEKEKALNSVKEKRNINYRDDLIECELSSLEKAINLDGGVGSSFYVYPMFFSEIGKYNEFFVKFISVYKDGDYKIAFDNYYVFKEDNIHYLTNNIFKYYIDNGMSDLLDKNFNVEFLNHLYKTCKNMSHENY
ncbi:hypothetical protein K9L67_03030 [Candidatus Woesearchaeota archaeon]|nr:hypothetical protein [Candidatus Woesearchaeota archaeon]MCF7901175.1 hypothetical protein [Candidatus Woesearchaeota archaeon]MCF8013811.1 hypothetical protein [Candidatus Woesearchaeota archaeon]